MTTETITRKNGTPLATSITPAIRDWLCKGGLEPEEVMAAGVSEGTLVLLWNLRHDKKKKCER